MPVTDTPPPSMAAASMASCFLQVAGHGARLPGRQALAEWLAGEAQALMPHRSLVVADVEPHLRAVHIQWSDPMQAHPPQLALSRMAQSWMAARGDAWPPRPCRLDPQTHQAAPVPATGPGPELPAAAWVHGLPLPAIGRYRLFLLLERQAGDSSLALELLAPFVDAVLRRSPGPGGPGAAAGALLRPIVATPSSPPLSERERQIMTWVAMGKTNPEIGCILRISEFTVKNHLKSIFGKLDVSNRAQAVAKLTGSFSHA